ncbi:DUF3570 domain-containing protein [Catenovulum maritimum]|uniref:DUF3570 domain-containing protein n=1 Tax=Catenovulum maritimum TaxID=1513271 RepID=A0A0J8JPV5_9ALTE|nr:DUF3570 domain-containing protein [Catenovulum maritimum]KMT66716.1 hypothetical protein XM47_00895 [Catenovulum maritimum]
MQLKTKNIQQLLTVATCSLLGSAASAEESNAWSFDTALMYYGETDRVSAVEGIISGTKEYSDGHFLNLKLTLDTLTGASANGAVPQDKVQTFTRPSGKGSYDIGAGQTPLDDTFQDTRVQLNAQWTQPLAENYLGSAGVHFSKEYDYLSLGFNGNIARELNQKNTTLSLGVAYSYDSIDPEGGVPIAFTPMLHKGTEPNRLSGSENKTTIDMLFGVTQIINRRMLMQLNYSYSQVDGYLSDPFKVVSVVNDNGEALTHLYENRPDSRTKQSVFWQTKYHLTDSVIDFSYRYMWDDWDISSHTFDLRYNIPLSGSYFEPHVRYYIQSAAEFYRPFMMENEALDFASADYRIGEMDGLTLGVKYGMPLENNTEVSFRFELFKQTPTNPGYEKPGILANLELYESIDAVIFQINYSF